MPPSSVYESLPWPGGWHGAHGGHLKPAQDGALLCDGTAPMADWHLVRTSDPAFRATVRLTVDIQALPGCSTEFYVNHWGGVDVLRLAADGSVLDPGITTELTVERLTQDLPAGVHPRLRITAVFHNDHPTVSFGTAQGPGGRYRGNGAPQYHVRDAVVGVTAAPVPLEERLVLVDVGARGGLQDQWRRHRAAILPVFIEPDPASAQVLRERSADGSEALVIEAALADRDGLQRLHVTRMGGCTSLLEPDAGLLARFRCAPAFEVVRTLDVACSRYDTLHAAGLAPLPDVLKVDVQGAESLVLEGFGALLDHLVGIELEAHTLPIYRGQRLLGDIVSWLHQRGFALRRLREQPNFDGVAVEFDAFFTRHPERMPPTGHPAWRKLALAEAAWQLDVPPGGEELRQHALAEAAAAQPG